MSKPAAADSPLTVEQGSEALQAQGFPPGPAAAGDRLLLEPSPARVVSPTPHKWFAGAALLVCMAVYPDVLFGGRTFLPIGRVPAAYDTPPFSAGYTGRAAPGAEVDSGAHAWQIHPWAYVERRALASGTLPLWDRFNGMGHPLLANGLTQIFNPLHALVLLQPDSGLLWDIHFLLLRFVAALFSCYLLWELGVRREFCLLGAAFGGINPAFTIYLTRADLEAYALFPALLLCIFRLRREPRFGNASALCAALALTTVAGHPEPSFACLFAAASIAVVLALTPVLRARFLGWVAFAAGIALLVAAPYWLPLLKLVVQSYSSHAVGTGDSSRPPVLALQWLFPSIASRTSAFAIIDDPPALGFLAPAMSTLACSAFVGAMVVRRLGKRLLWVAGPVLLGLKIFGLPGAQWIGKLPLIDRMPTEVYFQFPVLYALGIAGVVAVSALADEPLPRRAGVLIGGALAMLALTGLAPRLFPAHALSPFWSLQAALAVAVTVAVAALGWVTLRGGVATSAASIALFALVAGDLAAHRQRLSTRGNLTAAAPYVRWLQARREEAPPFRVMGLRGRLMPNMAGAFALEDVRLTDALRPLEQTRFIRRFLQKDLLWDWFLTAETSHGFDPWNPILNWLNVKYIVAGEEILVGRRDALQMSLLRAGHTGWAATAYAIDGKVLPVVYQHPDDEGAARIYVPASHPVLALALAQDPAVWNAPGDGATYEVAVGTPAAQETVFSRNVDPKRDPADRHWVAGRVDLSRWAGSEVTLILRARSADTRADFGGWGDLHWESRAGERQAEELPRVRYDLVFRDTEQPETMVFENRDAWPRVFASDHPFVERDGEAVLDRIQSLLGSAGPHVVVADDFPSRQWESLEAGGRKVGPLRVAVGDVRHGQNDMTFAIEVDRPAVIVVAETLLPGWHATVDGAPEPLFRANYLFRGLLVSRGTHRVRLWYWPREWTVAFVLCALGCATWVGAGAVLRLRRGK